VEAIATSLSGKIWQKIMILDAPEIFGVRQPAPEAE
jgi:hypothetical protein